MRVQYTVVIYKSRRHPISHVHTEALRQATEKSNTCTIANYCGLDMETYCVSSFFYGVYHCMSNAWQSTGHRILGTFTGLSIDKIKYNIAIRECFMLRIFQCWPGFDFPRGPGAYAPRFCCGPLDFSD